MCYDGLCSVCKHASVKINSGSWLLVLYAENSSCSLVLSNISILDVCIEAWKWCVMYKSIPFLTKMSVKLYRFNLEEVNMNECVDRCLCFGKFISVFSP